MEFDEKCCIFALRFFDSLMIQWTVVTVVTVLFLKLSRVPRTHRRVFICTRGTREKSYIFTVTTVTTVPTKGRYDALHKVYKCLVRRKEMAV